MTLFKRLFGKAPDNGHDVRLFLETMLIMIAADGQVEDTEMSHFMAQVGTRPELAQISRRVIDQHMQEAFKAIRREGIEKRIVAIARGLQRRDQRLAAVAMAIAIAMGDGKLEREETAVLDMMQAAFELSDDDISEAIKAARRGDIDTLLNNDEGVERSFIETMMLMAAADGVIDPAEIDKFGHELAHQRDFNQISPQQVSSHLSQALEKLAAEGVEARLKSIASSLPREEQRQTAFKLALEMCLADGHADVHERALLKLLQEHFELSDDQVGRAVEKILGGGV